jgi:tripartite-type tricarboxylate transporter receptor subunit TctC
LRFSAGGFAQAYPHRPIKLIVPFPPAGSTDLSARAVAGKLQERMGQPVIVENRPGAGGNIGGDVAAKAPPDGYTLFVGTVARMRSTEPLLEDAVRPPQGLRSDHPALEDAERARREPQPAGELRCRT